MYIKSCVKSKTHEKNTYHISMSHLPLFTYDVCLDRIFLPICFLHTRAALVEGKVCFSTIHLYLLAKVATGSSFPHHSAEDVATAS